MQIYKNKNLFNSSKIVFVVIFKKVIIFIIYTTT